MRHRLKGLNRALTPQQLFSIIQNAIVFWEAGNGLGQKTSLISPSSLVKVQKVCKNNSKT